MHSPLLAFCIIKAPPAPEGMLTRLDRLEIPVTCYVCMSDLDSVLAAELSLAVAREERRIREAVAAQSIVLKLAGSFAVRERCPSNGYLLTALGRRPFRDIDYVGYWSQRRQIAELFESLEYTLDPVVRQSQEWGIKRFTYNRRDGLKVDIFLDELVMAHTIPFKGRLGGHLLTISIVDLLLSKLQIHEITLNDLIDMTVLLAEYDLEPQDDNGLDAAYLCSIMANDWGFYYTTLENLRKLEEALGRFVALPNDVRSRVTSRVEALRTRIEAEPKSRRWRLRAKVGPRMRWYEEVSEVDR